jgi:hypothetical protein
MLYFLTDLFYVRQHLRLGAIVRQKWLSQSFFNQHKIFDIIA